MSGMIPLARRLAAAIEPVAGQAQFSPECHANYEALGFAPSPGMVGRTALPDKGGFFNSRGAVLGDVPAEVVAAVFCRVQSRRDRADSASRKDASQRVDDVGGTARWCRSPAPPDPGSQTGSGRVGG